MNSLADMQFADAKCMQAYEAAPAAPTETAETHIQETPPHAFFPHQEQLAPEGSEPRSSDQVLGRANPFNEPEKDQLLQSGEADGLVHAFSVDTLPTHSRMPQNATKQQNSCTQFISQSSTEAERLRLLPASTQCTNTTKAAVPPGPRRSSEGLHPCSVHNVGSSWGAPQRRVFLTADPLLISCSQSSPKHQGSTILAWFQLSTLKSVVRKVVSSQHLLLLSLWWVAVSGPVMIFTESYCSNLFAGMLQNYSLHCIHICAC